MKRLGLVAATVAVLAMTAGAAAQMEGGYGSQSTTAPNTERTMPQSTQSSRGKAPPKPTKEQVMKDASDIVSSVQLPCTVSDVNLLGKGKANINGEMLDTENVEVACSNGLGYLLSSSPPQKTSGYTCIAADHARAAKGEDGAPACSLPQNADGKVIAGNVLGRLGSKCEVKSVNWIGVNSGNEYIEAACNGGTGYVLVAAMPGGSTTPPSAMSCVDAAKRGINCKMSSSGPAPVTFDTFKNALAQHGVACNSTNMRSMGKETVLKRHVLEFQCPQEHPQGLVALIPLEDSTAPFETLTCAQAASKYRLICSYVKP
jgi:hypothetical protein